MFSYKVVTYFQYFCIIFQSLRMYEWGDYERIKDYAISYRIMLRFILFVSYLFVIRLNPT